jgi:nucleotide-binding universal stress UspA family protein
MNALLTHVPTRTETRLGTALKTVLVPLKLTGPSSAVLRIARDVALQTQSTVILLHVVQLNIAGEESGIPRAELLAELCQKAESQLQQIADRMGGSVAVETLVCQGCPGEVIVEMARRLQTHLIIMPAQSRPPWLRWWHRNTARAVTRQAPCRVCLASTENRNAGKHLTTRDVLGMAG